MKPPERIDGAHVLRWSVTDERHRPTGNCRHVVFGELKGPWAGLVICRYENEKACYLFYCDARWNVVTDTWHETIEAALKQAEFEYEGVSLTWNVV